MGDLARHLASWSPLPFFPFSSPWSPPTPSLKSSKCWGREARAMRKSGGNPSTSSVAGSTSLSSSVASEGSLSSVSRCRREKMVVEAEELVAARALADFAQIAFLQREGGGSGSRDGGEGTEDVKLDHAVKGSGSRRFSLDLNQNAPAEEETAENVSEKKDAPVNGHMSKIRACCSTSRSPVAVGRTKLDLTEEEKEEKRLRRVLANRESARQTIRRRQALCEELKRKAAELSLENENIKMEKEHALKEYLLLSDTNRHLREKMAKRIILYDASMPLETPGSSSNEHPPVMHQRTPFIQFAYPPIARFLNPPIINTTDPSHEEGTYEIPTEPTTLPFFIPPYLWFYPIVQEQQQQRPSSVSTCAWGETGGDGATSLEAGGAPLSSRMGDGTAKSAEDIIGEHDKGFNGPPSIGDVRIEQELELHVKDDAGMPLPRGTAEHSPKKVLDAAVAAQSRKRRRELTQLKKHHGRGWQLHRRFEI